MGNAFCYYCSPCQEQNDISMEIMPALEGIQSMEDVEELIAYIDRSLSNIGTGGQEQINKPISTDSLINSGGNLIEKLSARLNWHVCKKCLLSALDRQTRKVVFDVINQAQPISYLGMALSVIAHLLERAEQASSNKDECLRLLRYMSVLAKHMKNLDIHLDRPKLNEILLFIVKETLMCARQMQPNSLCRFIFAPLDAADLENLKSELVHLYPDLQLQALTALLNTQNVLITNTQNISDRLPIVPGPSQGEYQDDTVGVEEAQNKVIELLDLGDSSRRVVVIYGVGGIGKTTLATAVFQRLELSSYYHCRVVMDQDSKHNDLKDMQEQILRDLFEENLKLNDWTQGREKLSEAFAKAFKPVFLFIDNALRQTDLEMLLPLQHLSRLPMQSRILLTTRNLNETKILELQDGIEVYPHRVDSLSELEAKRLLCQYALGDKNGSFEPGVDMDGLLQFCGGIPLVLRIVGSQLRTNGNNVSGCNEILEYHKKWQQKGFEGGEEDLSERIVDFVYKRLKETSKEAFLDIAFFFYDWERSEVGDIVGEMELRDLEGAALVTTSQEDVWEITMMRGKMVRKTKVKVKMHDIVKARGRKLSEGNRIMDIDSLSILLSDAQKLQQAKGIWLPNSFQVILEAKHVDVMSRSLRVLYLGYNTRLHGRCERAFKDLRFLHFSFEDMLPIDISKSRQLVYFYGRRISEAKFTINLPDSLRLLYLGAYASDPPLSLDIYGHLISLRELLLFNITFLNFNGNFSSLKLLDMNDCSMLERLPESFGNLPSLQYLYMNNCSMLERLPEGFGNLSSLQILYMCNCSKLERLPESFCNLSSLQTLNVDDCSKLKKLPESFGNLSSLQTLNMDDCSKLERLPKSFGNLSSMQELYMRNCSMLETLPESFGNLSSLQTLKMDDCSKLERLPHIFGNLSLIQELDMKNCSMLETLPESFGNLSSLQTLYMDNCSKLKRLPDSFGNLSSMQILHIRNCFKLERLPESFGNLYSLQMLYMDNCSRLETLPESFGNLSSLQILYIRNCSKLERLPESFRNLSSMKELYMRNCSMLETFHHFGNLYSRRKEVLGSLNSIKPSSWEFGGNVDTSIVGTTVSVDE